MICSAAVVGGIAAAALGGPAVAALDHDPPQATIDTAERTVEVRMIEVPVPTRDWAAETVQMGVAATLGAIIAARATAVRARRRSPPTTGLIDITDSVQASADKAGRRC